MAKLIVEIIEAGDLMPKDDQGSATLFDEIDFSGQDKRTQTKTLPTSGQKTVNAWNETLVFNVQEPKNLPFPPSRYSEWMRPNFIYVDTPAPTVVVSMRLKVYGGGGGRISDLGGG
ncbi:hypothetical protein L1987_17335 [Smallanthus sonchifolius]|uniref:Uncharacterized protein n=1 Tax=Smallanthus sonchifolius TaxID=185202 RepID=A0ACB9IX75_9ASTR|nr:hypothetical protein L1987_17335 [Smallanthus sonchifolius]